MLTGRLLVTLVRLRAGLTREALGVICQAGSAAIGRAIGEIRPLLAGRGFAVPQRPGPCLRTLAGVFACAEAETSRCASTAPEPRSAGMRRTIHNDGIARLPHSGSSRSVTS